MEPAHRIELWPPDYETGALPLSYAGLLGTFVERAKQDVEQGEHDIEVPLVHESRIVMHGMSMDAASNVRQPLEEVAVWKMRDQMHHLVDQIV